MSDPKLPVAQPPLVVHSGEGRDTHYWSDESTRLLLTHRFEMDPLMAGAVVEAERARAEAERHRADAERAKAEAAARVAEEQTKQREVAARQAEKEAEERTKQEQQVTARATATSTQIIRAAEETTKQSKETTQQSAHRLWRVWAALGASAVGGIVTAIKPEAAMPLWTALGAIWTIAVGAPYAVDALDKRRQKKLPDHPVSSSTGLAVREQPPKDPPG